MLPKPWHIPDDLFKEFKQIKKHQKEVVKSSQNLSIPYRVTQDKYDEVESMMNIWNNKAFKLAKQEGFDLESDEVAGYDIHVKLQLLVCLDQFDSFMMSLGRVPADMQEHAKAYAVIHLKRAEPSVEQIDVWISDIFNKRNVCIK